jgi:hypothetical protein
MKIYVLTLEPDFKEDTIGGVLGVFATEKKAIEKKEFFEGIGKSRRNEFEIEEWEIM